MSDDYKADLEIDFFALHHCYRDQAANFMEWAERWANKVQERDLRRRFLRMEIRKDPEKYDLKLNPSVAAVNALMEEDEDLIRLNWECRVLESAKDAIASVKFNIDGLTKLWLNGYFSGPHPSTMRIKEERSERVRQTQQEGLKHSKRIGGRKHDITSKEEDGTAEGGPAETAQGERGQE